MDMQRFLETIKDAPEQVEFEEVLKIISDNFDFVPVAFRIGEVRYQMGEAVRTCEVLAFARNLELSKTQTLSCFGRFYREDILSNPDGTDHATIRNFMRHGWQGVRFDGEALEPKKM